MSKTEQTVKQIFENLGYEVPMDQSTSLHKMGVDSLDLVELIMECEKAFEVSFNDDKVYNADLETYKQFVEFIKSTVE